MLMEVYYEHYREKCREAYWEDKKYIPYAVKIPDRSLREAFVAELSQMGFSCVNGINDYPVILVNTDLRRWASITKACKHSCVGDRLYTETEFRDEVLKEMWQYGV